MSIVSNLENLVSVEGKLAFKNSVKANKCYIAVSSLCFLNTEQKTDEKKETTLVVDIRYQLLLPPDDLSNIDEWECFCTGRYRGKITSNRLSEIGCPPLSNVVMEIAPAILKKHLRGSPDVTTSTETLYQTEDKRFNLKPVTK